MTNRFVCTALLLLCSAAQAREPWALSALGYGPVKFGMTVKHAQSLMQKKLQHMNNPHDPSCDHVYTSEGQDGISFMVRFGRLVNMTTSTSNVITKSGAKVGDSTSTLKALFGSQLEIQPHHDEVGGFYYYVWQKDRRHGIKFIIIDDKVNEILAGDDTIELVEGCA